MKAVITGATGAIGIALIKELIEEKNEILVITRKESNRNENLPISPHIKILYATLSELCELNVSNHEEYDVFYHLAWDGTVGESRNNLVKQCDNIKYTIDAVELAQKLGCKTFIGVGSQAEYGRSSEVLLPDTKANPENGYGVAKLCAGKMANLKANEYGMRFCWVRVLSVYGPNDRMQSLVMSTIQKVRNKQPVLCTKGEQLWDYLYSGDAAEALYLLGENENATGIYVLGSGESMPLKNFINTICSIVNPDAEVVFGAIPYSKNQVMCLKADITRLQKDVGWKPRTKFIDGIKMTLEYLQKV